MKKIKASQTQEELQRIQQESEKQALPEQKRVFSIPEKIRKRVHNLPDPARPPLGYDEHKAFDLAFPYIRLPRLHPVNHGDTVIFNAPDLPANQLFLGDNLEVLRTLPSESIDLIYIDPPFFSGRNYNVIWGDSNEVRSFYDIWEGGIDSYLIWLNARLWEMRRILKKTGSIYVHCDYHASHYIKTEMDKIFGYDNFLGEVIWHKNSGGIGRTSFSKRHDILLYFSKTQNFHYDGKAIGELREQEKGTFGGYFGVDETGREYREVRKAGKVYKYYMDEPRNPEDVWEVPQIPERDKTERIGYPTQKPEKLLERIIKASSREGEFVADFFCGGGTTPAVAQKLNRQFIGCDSSRVAIAVTLDRLVKVGEEMSGVKTNISAPGAHQLKIQAEGAVSKIANIETSYLGVYPIDKFEKLPQEDFIGFVLTSYGASRNTAESVIDGLRPPAHSEPILIGPSNPNESIDAKEIKKFFDEIKESLEPNKPVQAKVIGWRFSPKVQEYIKTLSKYVAENKLFAEDEQTPLIDLELVPLRSNRFRDRVLSRYPEIQEAEFFLRFPEPPVIGDIRVKKVSKLEYEFEAIDALSTEEDGWLVNCQWDFDYQEGHFSADKEYILSREKIRDKQRGEIFKAVLRARHTFEKPGEYTIACKVQDNLAGEIVFSKMIKI